MREQTMCEPETIGIEIVDQVPQILELRNVFGAHFHVERLAAESDRVRDSRIPQSAKFGRMLAEH